MNTSPAPSGSGGSSAPPLGLQLGSVVEFDEDRGLGVVASGEHRWMFHCTTIADGSRAIDIGIPVAFVVRAGGPGRWEAFEITPTPT